MQPDAPIEPLPEQPLEPTAPAPTAPPEAAPAVTVSAPILAETPSTEPLAAPPLPDGKPITAAPGQCPVCGKRDLKNVGAHVRAAHGNNPGRAGGIAKAAKTRGETNGSQAADLGTAADFTDLTAEPAAPAPPIEPQTPKFEAMANMTFDMSTGILARIFGPEWLSSDPDERASVVLAIQKYYASVNLPDIPPGYMLCFVIAAYSAPRLGAQPTRTKLQAAWLWLKMKFTRKKPLPVLRVNP